jgi:hypothetical protein
MRERTRHLSTHHRKPQSIGGKDRPRNISQLPQKQHQAWHTCFWNLTAEQIAEEINEKYLDPDFIFVVRRREL